MTINKKLSDTSHHLSDSIIDAIQTVTDIQNQAHNYIAALDAANRYVDYNDVAQLKRGLTRALTALDTALEHLPL